MQARMKNPAFIVPDSMQALQALGASAAKGGVPARTLALVHLRASQINGCSFCVDMHSRQLKTAGDTDERVFAVAAWREAPYFTDAERAALALTEAVTRLSDRADPVPDEIWEAAARQYDEPALRPWSSPSPRSTSGTASTSPPGRWRARCRGTRARRPGSPAERAAERRVPPELRPSHDRAALQLRGGRA